MIRDQPVRFGIWQRHCLYDQGEYPALVRHQNKQLSSYLGSTEAEPSYLWGTANLICIE